MFAKIQGIYLFLIDIAFLSSSEGKRYQASVLREEMSDLPARIKQMHKLHGSSIGGGVSPYHPESSQNQNPNAESWKAFDKGSEAGRLMAKLYGGAYKPAINYPLPRSKKAGGVRQPAWRPSDKGNAIVSKFDKKAASKVSAPKFPKVRGSLRRCPARNCLRRSLRSQQTATSRSWLRELALGRDVNVHHFLRRCYFLGIL